MNLEDLNPLQKKAVTNLDSHSLVLAGAGSGKTKVLSSRIAWLLETNKAYSFDILAVTFTNKAAREMVSRVSSLLDSDMRSLWIGTFHSLCHRMLRLNWHEANLLQNFQIIDMSDQLSLIKRIMKNIDFIDSKYTARDLQKSINSYKEEGIRSNKVDVHDSYSRYVSDFYKLYEDQCVKDGLVDFSELLLKSYELLKYNQEVRSYYQDRFKHILIDEFQDTNNLQYDWLRLLVGNNTTLFAVGDDDQSIYGFRGANINNMSLFDKEYSRGNIIRLEQNYRSLGHILGAANSLIKNNNGRLGKNLWTKKGNGDKVTVVERPNDIAESQWIVDEIKKLSKNKTSLNDIAILYRSNAQSRVLEHAFFVSGIPYRVYGGLRFFERQEIKNVLSYLRVIVNRNDDSSWLRAVNFPPRGIGSKTIETLSKISNENNISLYESVKHYPGRSKNNLLLFNKIIDTLEDFSKKLPISKLIDHILDYCGINSFYKNEKDGEDRIDNLKELITASLVFSHEDGYVDIPANSLIDLKERNNYDYHNNFEINQENTTPLISFLSHASLEAGDNQSNSDNSFVQLMTVHAAKGLEFDIVFITGVEEGLFPHENSISDNLSIEEERRLMYVAITRAREKLYITMANSRMLRGQVRYSVNSRFISEIDENHIVFIKNRDKILPNNYLHKSKFDSVNIINKSYDNLLSSNQKFFVGQNVKHKSFGEGTIIKLIGSGHDSQAQINFSKFGIKTIMLSVAKLN